MDLKTPKHRALLLMPATILFCLIVIIEAILYYSELIVAIPKMVEYFQLILAMYIIIISAYLLFKVDGQ